MDNIFGTYDVINVILSKEEGNIYGYSVVLSEHHQYFKKLWFRKDDSFTNRSCCAKCGSLSHSASRCDRDYKWITIGELEEIFDMYKNFVENNQLYIETYKYK